MFELIDLPYGIGALEPVISARTLEFHHGKHLQAYVDNLNKLVAGTAFEGQPLKEIVRNSDGAVFNNAGQILNHELYFTQFRPVVADAAMDAGAAVVGGSSAVGTAAAVEEPSLQAPTGKLLRQIEAQWGSLEALQAEFEAKGTGLFGSGWVWLSADENGGLVITQESGAGNPVTRVLPGQTAHLRPLLTFDVWEHAYYLDYQNRRAAHLHALWSLIDWPVVEKRYAGE